MINFEVDVLAQLTRDVWETMLDISLQPGGEDAAKAFWNGSRSSGRERFLSGCVQVAGAWSGAVRVDCSQGFASRTAAAFLATKQDEVSREQMLDALGEVTNMVTGSVKRLLPAPCHISLPSVVDGTDYELNIRKGKRLLETEFVSDGEPLKVSLFEAEPACAGEAQP